VGRLFGVSFGDKGPNPDQSYGAPQQSYGAPQQQVETLLKRYYKFQFFWDNNTPLLSYIANGYYSKGRICIFIILCSLIYVNMLGRVVLSIYLLIYV